MKRGVIVGLCGLLLAIGCGGRTGLVDDLPDAGIGDGAPDGPTMLRAECGESERFTQPGRSIALEVELVGPVPVVRQQWTLRARPEGSTAEIAPTSGEVTGITPDVTGMYEIHFEAEDADGTRVECDYDVVSTLEDPVVECPAEPIFVPVGMPTPLRGQGERVFTWRWALLSTPPGGSATLEPTDAREIEFTGTELGAYRLRVTGFGVDGASDACELTVQVTGGPEVTCPTEEISGPTRQPLTISAEATDETGIQSVRWEVIERPEGSTAAPASPNARTTRFTPDRQGVYVLEFTATDTDGLESMCQVRVRGLPSPPDAQCPATVVTEPLQTVELEGDAIDDGRIVSWQWALTRQPPGSALTGPQPANAQVTRFQPDVAGEYVLELTVTDDDGMTGRCDVLVEAVAQEGLRVEVFWNGPPDNSCPPGVTRPGCDGSDVDAHLLRPGNEPWTDLEGDCHWRNCDVGRGLFLDWGDPGSTEDDPRLDLDDRHGFGPENINLDEPVPGTYRVGVYFWEGENRSTADVVVNIYCGASSSTPAASIGPTTLRDRATSDPSSDNFNNDFWRVADVRITRSGCDVIDLSLPDGSPNIITYAEATTTR